MTSRWEMPQDATVNHAQYQRQQINYFLSFCLSSYPSQAGSVIKMEPLRNGAVGVYRPDAYCFIQATASKH